VPRPCAGQVAKHAKTLDKHLADAYRRGPGEAARLGSCQPRTMPACPLRRPRLVIVRCVSLCPAAARGTDARSASHARQASWPPPSLWCPKGVRGPLGALAMRPQLQRRGHPMRPSPSLAYVSTLLDQRRRRHHRVRRLWYAGLGLLGLGLLLGGWWVTLRWFPRSAHAATAVFLVRLPALPCGATGPGGASAARRWEGPTLLGEGDTP